MSVLAPPAESRSWTSPPAVASDDNSGERKGTLSQPSARSPPLAAVLGMRDACG